MEASTSTSLMEVRDFLTSYGSGTPAWSSSRASVDALYELLQQRREDNDFWSQLSSLARRIQDIRVRPALIEGAEVLDGATVDQLLVDLRREIGADDVSRGGARRWISSSRCASALAAFLLLGTAMGCGKVECEGGVEAHILGEDNQEIFCELVSLTFDAQISTSIRDAVLECLPDLSNSYRKDLLDRFENATDEELAQYLTSLANSYRCGPDYHEDIDFFDDNSGH